MKKLNLNSLLLILLGVSVTTAVGCTKERAFDNIKSDKTSEVKDESKSLIDTEAEYLYVPSSLNSTRTTDATFPMYMGEAKIVRLQLAENELKVVEVDSDDRFSGNPVNDKPVLTIPIEHIDYRCALDADGKCTNSEEVDVGKPWAERKYIKIRADRLAVQEINFLPVEIKNLFQPCYNEVASAFVGYKLEKDAINVDVEKTYKSNIECAGNISSLSDLTFKVVYHYSLAKLNTITTPNYKPLSYSRKEESTFGFFDTNTLKLDRDNNNTEHSHKTFLNRWSPKKTVVYHMTENFNKVENAKIKAATIVGIANINKSLELAGAELRIDLQDASPGMNPGDLRVNSIVMVEDPVNYGILGYGPTAANPLTGEIVHGRAAMYLGVIKTGIKRAYEEVVAEKLSQIQKSKSETKTEGATDGSGDVVTVGDEKGSISLASELIKYTGARPVMNAREYKQIKESAAHTPGAVIKTASMTKNNLSGGDIRLPVNAEKLRSQTLRLNERKLTLRDAVMLKEDESIRDQVLSTHCFYDIADFNMHDALDKEIEKMIEDLGAKPWTELTDAEKDRVIDTLVPFVWIPTLIHEVGHTLGLRHNFAGSEDKDNFYSAEELAEMGISRKFNYSSVMDYGYRSTNELQVMGKYDIAALRFGYAEKIMLNDNSTLVSIEKFRAEPSLEIKPFKYCTDEHVAVNPNCNRFDEGTTLVEQANHWMSMYEQNYARRNLRNGQYDFSLYDDARQISRMNLIMMSLRTNFERYEDIKETYGLTDDSPVWEQYDFLKDLKQASRMAGNFFMQVLETPDTLCAAARASKPEVIVGVVPLRLLSNNAISCLDSTNVKINPAYVIVGEAGKSFQSRKDPRSGNPYMDQIDVRGIWIDKLMAAKALVGRMTGIESFDEFTGNFLDLSDMRESLQNRLSALLLDETVTKVPIFTVTGQVLVAELPVHMYNAAENMNGHKIAKPLHPGVQKYFGIANKGVDFQVKLVDVLKSSLPSQAQGSDSTSLLNSISANAGLPMGSAPDDFIQADIGLQRFYVNLQSQVASLEVMSRDVIGLFASLGEQKLLKIIADIDANVPLDKNASAEEKIARQLGKDVIEKYLQDGFQDKSFYEKMIQSMAL